MEEWIKLIPDHAQDYISNRRLDEVECLLADLSGISSEPSLSRYLPLSGLFATPSVLNESYSPRFLGDPYSFLLLFFSLSLGVDTFWGSK